jgi:hypothetical protein
MMVHTGRQQKHWKPRYTISSSIARALMEIEAVKTIVEHTPLSPAVEAQIRNRARIRSTHYSTRMVRILLNKWADDGWLLIADTSNRGRA